MNLKSYNEVNLKLKLKSKFASSISEINNEESFNKWAAELEVIFPVIEGWEYDTPRSSSLNERAGDLLSKVNDEVFTEHKEISAHNRALVHNYNSTRTFESWIINGVMIIQLSYFTLNGKLYSCWNIPATERRPKSTKNLKLQLAGIEDYTLTEQYKLAYIASTAASANDSIIDAVLSRKNTVREVLKENDFNTSSWGVILLSNIDFKKKGITLDDKFVKEVDDLLQSCDKLGWRGRVRVLKEYVKTLEH